MPILSALALGAILQEAKDLDAAVLKLYSVISGGAGEKRDWVAFKDMFAADARMRVVARLPDGQSRLVTLTPDDYVTRSGPSLERDGFFEKEAKRTLVSYGDLVHVWSSYEALRKPEDEKPFMRGVNSIQLAKIEGKWKILSIAWSSERDAGVPPPR